MQLHSTAVHSYDRDLTGPANLILFDSNFNSGRCHKSKALPKYINRRYTSYIYKCTPNEQARGDGTNKNLPEIT